MIILTLCYYHNKETTVSTRAVPLSFRAIHNLAILHCQTVVYNGRSKTPLAVRSTIKLI